MIPVFSQRFLPAIKTATMQALSVIGWDLQSVANSTRVEKTQLHAYKDRNKPSVVPLDVAIDLDTLAQRPILLEAFAHALGYEIIPSDIGPGHFGRDMGDFALTAGDVMRTAMKIWEDQRIDPHEADEIAPKIAHAITILRKSQAVISKVQSGNTSYTVASAGGHDD
ncbi:MAG: hypothetical protein ABF746_08615 [Acetobacter orientalis]